MMGYIPVDYAYSTLDLFREKSAQIDATCEAAGRDPASARRSVMTLFVIGADTAAIQGCIDAHRATFPNLPGTLTKWRAAGFIGGHPIDVAEQLKAFEAADVQRFILRQNGLDDLASLELLSKDVLPHLN